MKITILLFLFYSISLNASEQLKNLSINFEKFSQRCEKETEPNLYSTASAKKLAYANLQAQAQHYALKKIIIFLADAAKHLSLPRQQFVNTLKTIVKNQCSSNMTIISKSSLQDLAFDRFDSFESELNYTKIDYVEGFKVLADFCSWHGVGHKNSMIGHYLQDPLFSKVVTDNYVNTTTPVLCEKDKCRLTSRSNFIAKYKRSKNKVTFEDEVNGLYCFQVKNKRYQEDNPRDPYTTSRLENSTENLKKSKIYLYSSLINQPGPPILKSWSDHYSYFFTEVVKSEVQSTQDILNLVSKKVELEESFNIRSHVKKNSKLPTDIQLNFDIHADEFDFLVHNVDKLSWNFKYEITQKHIAYILSRIDRIYNTEFDNRKRSFDVLSAEVARRISRSSLNEKLSKVPTLKFVPNLNMTIAQSLVKNLSSYTGDKNEFLNSKSKVLEIPINISFGWQALRKLSKLRSLDIK